MKTLDRGEMNMKTNSKAWVIPGVLSALLLGACGGGGGGTGSTDVVPTTPSFTITSVDAETAAVRVTANASAAVQEVQVLVSTVQTLTGENATSEEATTTTIRGVLLYNSAEGVSVLPTIAASGSNVFSLKNVNFSAASTDTANAASSASCASNTDNVLGTVRLEVFSQGVQLFERDVPVCALQGTTYPVTL